MKAKGEGKHRLGPFAKRRRVALSVLVPVYNAAAYLDECLESLTGQTWEDLEVICIDDGSTDESPAMLARWASRDARIRVVSKANSGYGDSMNRGLAKARGTWVGICEPDDFCAPDMYEKLISAAERFGCDMAKANYRTHESGQAGEDPLRETLAGLPYGRPFRPRRKPAVLFSDPSIWSAVYKRSMIRRNRISFRPSPGASFQDASFSHQCWACARRVVLLEDGLYHYRVDNAASSVKSGDKVYAVCEEYDNSLAFLRGRGAKSLLAFAPTLHVVRFGAYIWNYNRIAPEHHLPFAERWVRDIVAAFDEGLLDLDLFTPEHAHLLAELLDDPRAFCAAHPDEIAYPRLR